jgi:putative nucleotidyltransferase with HDIG domain
MNPVNHYVDLAMKSLTQADKVDYIGEPVTQLEHALQAAYFAEQSGHSEEVILASLFHDIGHFAAPTPQTEMADLGKIHHEWIGAKLAYEMGFSQHVSLLIGYHVLAKRYLAGKKEKYCEKLSDASKKTLAFQGGPLSAEEIKVFELHRYYKEILQVRINDEKAKQIGLKVPDLSYYHSKIENHISQNSELTEFVDDAWVKRFRSWIDGN